MLSVNIKTFNYCVEVFFSTLKGSMLYHNHFRHSFSFFVPNVCKSTSHVYPKHYGAPENSIYRPLLEAVYVEGEKLVGVLT